MSAINYLMPDVYTKHISDDSLNLENLDLNQVLKTHILDETGRYLLPISLLLEDAAKVNLIPFNPFPMTQYQRSSNNVINLFKDKLIVSGINTITRKTRGDDIDAACGQLAGKVVFDRTSRSSAWKKQTVD